MAYVNLKNSMHNLHKLHYLHVKFHETYVGQDKEQNLSVKMLVFSYPYIATHVLGAQKNPLIETVLLSTHNKKIIFLLRSLN